MMAAWGLVAVLLGATQAPKPHEAAVHRAIELGCDVRLKPLWRVPLVRLGLFRQNIDSFGAPAISLRHNIVVAGSADGAVMGVSLADGRVVWRRKVGVPVEAEVALMAAPGAPAKDMAVVGLHDGTLLALDAATGHRIWEAALGGEVRARVSAAGPAHLVATTTHNEVMVLSRRDGRVRWTQARPAPTGLTLQGQSRAAVADAQIFVTFSDGFAASYALNSGEELWSRPLSLLGGRFIDADAHPVLENGRLFVASTTDGIFALNPKDGSTLWQHPTAHVGALAALGDSLFASAVDGRLLRLRQDTGALLSKISMGAEPAGAVESLGDAVVVLSGTWGMTLVGADGRPQGSQSLGGQPGDALTVQSGYVAHISRSGYLSLWQDQLRVPRFVRTL